MGYDGIAFSSSLTPDINKKHPDRFNIVIFNYEKCDVIKSNVIEINGINIEAKQIDVGDKIDVRSFIKEELDELHSYAQKIIDGEIIPNTNSN